MSTISNTQSLAYEFGSTIGDGSKEIKRLAKIKKKKKQLLVLLSAEDKGKKGTVSV